MTAHKVMLLGEIGVGKSSLARRLVYDKFETVYTPTIGVDVYKYQLPQDGAAQPESLIIWDTDGNFGDTIFKHVYIKQASAAIIVGDVTRRATLDAMVRLSEGFASALPGRHFSFIVNKVDLLKRGEEPELPAALSRHGVDLTLTSAMTGAHVTDAFQNTANTIIRRGQ